MIKIKDASFVQSATSQDKLPATKLPEYAFIGRSNVGKSSLINMLCDKKIAKTSSTPGKTQTINHFLIDNTWYLADLPGYGYAKVSKKLREGWENMIKTYLKKRQNLCCVFLLIDLRIPAQEIDLNFMYWMGEQKVPFVIIFTKIDKLKPNQIKLNIENYTNALAETWEELPKIFYSSSILKQGKQEILEFILENNKLYTD